MDHERVITPDCQLVAASINRAALPKPNAAGASPRAIPLSGCPTNLTQGHTKSTRLRLPDVTLVAVDGASHALTRRALEDTLHQIEPADVIVWSDRSEAVPRGASWVQCAPLPSYLHVSSILWSQVPLLVKTSHFLLIQWDSWVLDSAQWTPEFLEYDYLGALWWYRDGLNVGNGGFSLRSARLGRYLLAHTREFPVTEPEDGTLCRRYRPTLECEGFRWPPETLAARFAFEFIPPTSKTFGFHGHLHWPALLDPILLMERLALTSDYVRRKPSWAKFVMAIGTPSFRRPEF